MERKAPVSPHTFNAKVLTATWVALMIGLGWQSAIGQQQSPQLPDPGSPSGMTKQQEQVGLQAMAEVYKQMPVMPDSSSVTQYVQQLGKKLTPVIPEDKSWPYQFHVVPQKEINAFALPGGPIFVNIGTTQAASDETELAGIMAMRWPMSACSAMRSKRENHPWHNGLWAFWGRFFRAARLAISRDSEYG